MQLHLRLPLRCALWSARSADKGVNTLTAQNAVMFLFRITPELYSFPIDAKRFRVGEVGWVILSSKFEVVIVKK